MSHKPISMICIIVAASIARGAIPEPDAVMYGELRINKILVTQADDVSVVARVAGVPDPVGSYRFGAAPPGDCDNNGIADTCDLNCSAPGCVGIVPCGTAVDVNPADGLPDICPGDRYVLKVRVESLADGSPPSPNATTIGSDVVVSVYVRQAKGPEVLVGGFINSRRGIIRLQNIPGGPCFGDTAPAPTGDGLVDVDDILCVLDGFVDIGLCNSADIAPCGGNGLIDVDDILAVLDAFTGIETCPDFCQN